MTEPSPSRNGLSGNGNGWDDGTRRPSSSSAARPFDTIGDSDENDSNSMDGEPEEVMTLAEVVKAVELAWQNEKLTADLLVPASMEVEHLVSQVKVMERNLEVGCRSPVKQLLHSMEVNRLRFLISSYYRTRLYKVEEYAWYLNTKEEERKKVAQEYRDKKSTRRPPTSRLMPNEQKYLTEYLHIMEGHFTNVMLKLMPPPLQRIDRSKFIKEPHLDTFVFFEANEEHDVYEPDQQIYVQLQIGVKYMMRYRLVAQLLTAGAITLV